MSFSLYVSLNGLCDFLDKDIDFIDPTLGKFTHYSSTRVNKKKGMRNI